ncbi:HD domain-containing phosphohydrolase [Candidatus Chloroploca asiatica]|nr:HD domain-containing phosphohydrolase [Candidatus Chloroploca asiatica]
MMPAPSIVLIVDDNPIGRETLEDLLYGQGYTLAFAADGPEALQQAAALTPDVILLDVMMPGMDGFEVCRRLRTDPHLAEVPVVMVTALDDSESRLRGLEAGADDFISKPFKRAELRARVKTITRLNRYRSLLEERAALQHAHEDLIASYDATIEGWVHALDLRDKETEGHSLRVTEMTIRMARAAGTTEPELTALRRGALLHDIGKLGIPDAILLKPGPLTDEEWAIMHQHPQYAYDMLAPITYLQPALDIPYCHHEKWDGTGYPRGLAGNAIPLAARLFAVVDVWDALRSDRPYRRGWPEHEVLAYLRAQAGTHFDPWAVELFFQVLEAMPCK